MTKSKLSCNPCISIFVVCAYCSPHLCSRKNSSHIGTQPNPYSLPRWSANKFCKQFWPALVELYNLSVLSIKFWCPELNEISKVSQNLVVMLLGYSFLILKPVNGIPIICSTAPSDTNKRVKMLNSLPGEIGGQLYKGVFRRHDLVVLT